MNADRDSTSAAVALLCATLIIAHQVAGKATRDALFLTYFDVTNLPRVVIVAAVLSIGGVFVMSALLSRSHPAKVIPRVFAVSAVLFVAEWLVFTRDPGITSILLYLHMAVFGATLISGFWSVVNERFDPHTAKRTVARIAAATTLGGIIGGVVAQRVSALIDMRAMLLVLSAMHMICALGVAQVGRGVTSAPQARIEVGSGLSVLSRSPYLLQMSALMILIALAAAFIDYAMKSEAAARFSGGDGLITFFATFYAVVGLVSFGVQSMLGARWLQRFGLAGTIGVLPVMVMVGGVLSAVLGKLWTVVALKGVEAVFVNSFFRSGFELLYTPVAPARKRPTKTIIDVASNRIGDMLGGGVLLGIVAVMTEPPTTVVVGLAAVCGAMALLVIVKLHRGYVAQLADSMRDGSVALEIDERLDAATRQILAETTPDADRALLLERIASGASGASGAGGVVDADSDDDPRVVLVRHLCGEDREQIVAALRSPDLDATMVGYLIPLLGRESLAEDARVELRWFVPRIIGQLTDALLDPEHSVEVRQRLPSVMEVFQNPRTVDGLWYGLNDPEFSIRYSCARALSRMNARSGSIGVTQAQVFVAVEREVMIDSATWHRQAEFAFAELGEEEDDFAGVDPSLQHVFAILSLALDRDAVNLAMNAVSSQDRLLRGTALEYLDNLLPPKIRDGLWRHIGVSSDIGKSRRSRTEILDDLKRAAREGEIR